MKTIVVKRFEVIGMMTTSLSEYMCEDGLQRKNRRYALNEIKSIDLPKVRFSKHYQSWVFSDLCCSNTMPYCSFLTILQCTQVFPFSEEESIQKTEIIKFRLVRQFA